MFYILEGKKPVLVKDVAEWRLLFESDKRTVNRTEIRNILISTVFLGLDMSYRNRPPLLFETMIFGGAHDQYQNRYSTWEEAEKGHDEACKMVINSL